MLLRNEEFSLCLALGYASRCPWRSCIPIATPPTNSTAACSASRAGEYGLAEANESAIQSCINAMTITVTTKSTANGRWTDRDSNLRRIDPLRVTTRATNPTAASSVPHATSREIRKYTPGASVHQVTVSAARVQNERGRWAPFCRESIKLLLLGTGDDEFHLAEPPDEAFIDCLEPAL